MKMTLTLIYLHIYNIYILEYKYKIVYKIKYLKEERKKPIKF